MVGLTINATLSMINTLLIYIHNQIMRKNFSQSYEVTTTPE